MIMRVSARLFLWGIGGLLVMSCFSFIAHGNVHSKADKSDDEASSYGDAPAMNKEHIQDSCQAAQKIEALKSTKMSSSQQATCIPVFNAFLTKLLKEIETPGLPTAEMHYDAEVKLFKHVVSEIQKLVNDESSWTTGALDDALSQILLDFKLHDFKARTWRFEDSLGVDLDTVIKVLVMAMIIVVIICIEGWSKVSWFFQFWRMFAVCFSISLVWNWFYLYKMACAEHQAKMVKWEKMMEKCTGGKKNDWLDDLRDWYRTTWTLQDDPCKEYFELLIVHPILRVPPTKVITMTLTTLITDPLMHIGQGINAFLRALLKDLPITLQIPVFILIVLSSLVFLYSVGQAAVLWCLRGRRQDSPPGIVDQPDAPPNRLSGEEESLSVETLQNAERLHSGGETDTQKEAVAEDLDPHTTEKKCTPTTSKEPSGTKDNKVSGNTERNEVGDSVTIEGDASKTEDCVENIGTLS